MKSMPLISQVELSTTNAGLLYNWCRMVSWWRARIDAKGTTK